METKTQTQHTPGPWAVDDGSIHAETTVYKGPSGASHDIVLMVPIDDRENYMTTATDRANLTLAAAAPELLEALEGLMAGIQSVLLVTSGRALSPMGVQTILKDNFSRAADAIAKARGQA